jgi:hypothetical protein
MKYYTKKPGSRFHCFSVGREREGKGKKRGRGKRWGEREGERKKERKRVYRH